ncbi:MAG: hypothetical protein IE913_08340 [Halothiobacillus sp.]|nr:hypothetical protein [Halothiobacillus sp.]
MNPKHDSIFIRLNRHASASQHDSGYLMACEAIAKKQGMAVVSKTLRRLVGAWWTTGVISCSEAATLESEIITAALLEV